MGPLAHHTAAVYEGTASAPIVFSTGCILALIMLSSSALALSSTGIEVAIERDWYVSPGAIDPNTHFGGRGIGFDAEVVVEGSRRSHKRMTSS